MAHLTGYHFGHLIYSPDGTKDWYYGDDDSPVATSPPRRCPKCSEYPTEDDHDPCISRLPGVAYACCGHGVERGYVKFETGLILRGNFEFTHEDDND